MKQKDEKTYISFPLYFALICTEWGGIEFLFESLQEKIESNGPCPHEIENAQLAHLYWRQFKVLKTANATQA